MMIVLVNECVVLVFFIVIECMLVDLLLFVVEVGI